ncbi:hypothetical protein ON010_g16648 [Phytophthora cinnamomi]|nr:hypothetical protein ON010_g16648 [Phytophthora cinnamomi]
MQIRIVAGRIAAAMEKGVVWSEHETLQLCLAWLAISEDPIRGAGQKKATFFERVYQQWLENVGANAEPRSEKAIAGRWKKMQPEVTKFEGIYMKLQSQERSDWSEQTYIENTAKIYQERTKQPFEYLAAWKELRNKPKWSGKTTTSLQAGKKRKAAVDGSLELQRALTLAIAARSERVACAVSFRQKPPDSGGAERRHVQEAPLRAQARGHRQLRGALGQAHGRPTQPRALHGRLPGALGRLDPDGRADRPHRPHHRDGAPAAQEARRHALGVRGDRPAVSADGRALGGVVTETMATLEKFEHGMGLTLKNAWLHAEAVQVRIRCFWASKMTSADALVMPQTTDLPLLIEYIHDILIYCLERPDYLPNKKMDNCQEVTVIHFLLGLCRQLDSIDESRIMPLFAEKRIFALLAMHLSSHINLLNAADIAVGAEVLALICSTEDFDSHDDYYVDSPEAESALLSLYDDYLEEATEDLDTRKRLRPLLDAVRQLNYNRK